MKQNLWEQTPSELTHRAGDFCFILGKWRKECHKFSNRSGIFSSSGFETQYYSALCLFPIRLNNILTNYHNLHYLSDQQLIIPLSPGCLVSPPLAPAYASHWSFWFTVTQHCCDTSCVMSLSHLLLSHWWTNVHEFFNLSQLQSRRITLISFFFLHIGHTLDTVGWNLSNIKQD